MGGILKKVQSSPDPGRPQSTPFLIALCFGRPITKPACPENLASFIPMPAFLIVSALSFKRARDRFAQSF